MYNITPYSYSKAKQLGVQIKPSVNPKYKLDVFDSKNQFITSVGAYGYKDYPTYILEKGLDYANERRRLYRIRHEKDRKKVGTRGYYADKLLW